MNLSLAAIHVEAAALMIRYDRQRVGQAYFVALATAASFGNGLSGNVLHTSFDPFNNDGNLERFLAYLRYQLGEFDHEIAEVTA